MTPPPSTSVPETTADVAAPVAPTPVTPTPTTPGDPGKDKPSLSNSSCRRLGIKFPARGDLPALGRVRTSKNARRVAVLLMIGLASSILLMAFAPWLQNVLGEGRVINYDPTIRPQTVDAPISGRVLELGEGIYPMAKVKKGQVIAEMVDLDPDRLARMQQQLENLRQFTAQSELALSAAKSELSQAEQAVVVLTTNVETRRQVQREAIATAEANINIAEQRLVAAEKALVDREAIFDQAFLDYERQKSLFERDFVSEKKFQIAEKDYLSAQANVDRAKADIEAAKKDVESKKKERDTKERTTQSDIESALVTLRNADAKVESLRKAVAGAEKDVRTAKKNEIESESAVTRQANGSVTSPIDGYVVDIYADGGSKVFAQGEPVAYVVPESEDRVVEILLDGNDAPLVEPGRHVRLQFEGWPAIQFTGWPSVAVGTFGGEVLSVDAVDNGSGQFRALVGEVSGLVPETGLVDEPWPHGRFLRPGVRAKGWVLLETVPLWWEVWRNLNGFPPVVDTEHEDKPSKVPKLPKP